MATLEERVAYLEGRVSEQGQVLADQSTPDSTPLIAGSTSSIVDASLARP